MLSFHPSSLKFQRTDLVLALVMFNLKKPHLYVWPRGGLSDPPLNEISCHVEIGSHSLLVATHRSVTEPCITDCISSGDQQWRLNLLCSLIVWQAASVLIDGIWHLPLSTWFESPFPGLSWLLCSNLAHHWAGKTTVTKIPSGISIIFSFWEKAKLSTLYAPLKVLSPWHPTFHIQTNVSVRANLNTAILSSSLANPGPLSPSLLYPAASSLPWIPLSVYDPTSLQWPHFHPQRQSVCFKYTINHTA